MANRSSGTFSRRGPDFLTEELAVALSGKEKFEFKPLFTQVYASLRARNLAGGGEEMFRLRIYEKLQTLVGKGMVKRVTVGAAKFYSGTATLAAALPAAPEPAKEEVPA